MRRIPGSFAKVSVKKKDLISLNVSMVLFNYIFMAEKHFRGYHRGDLDPVSRTCFKNIRTSRASKGNIKPLFFNVQGRREILRFLRNERINSRVTYIIRCKSRLTLVHISTNYPRPSVKVTLSILDLIPLRACFRFT